MRPTTLSLTDPRRLRRGLATVASISLCLATPAASQGIEGMPIVGYADRLSVAQGETIRFMVSSREPRYRADVVRLIHGDTNPGGPGFKEEVIESALNQTYPGRHQNLAAGSYVLVEDHPSLRLSGSFTLQAWIAPTTPGKGVQGIVTKYSAEDRRESSRRTRGFDPLHHLRPSRERR